MSQTNIKYDLAERTAKFGERTIILCKKIAVDSISKVLINQLVRSSTSVGANYMEANGASSKLDFRNKIFICKKECQETKHWLRMLATSNSVWRDELAILWKEAQELTLIFQKITTTLSKKKQNIEN